MLVISLLMLLVITLLATDAMRIANFDLALATNTQAQTRALSVAENGLADAEQFIITNFPSVPSFDWSTNDTDGLYMAGDLATPPITAVDWTASDGAYQAGTGDNRYAVEYLGAFSVAGGSLTTGAGSAPEQRFLYLITARGQTASGSVRFVQSVFATGN